MAFKRQLEPIEVLNGTGLTKALCGIGMRFSGKAARNSPIEDALFYASSEGMVGGDLRVLSVLTMWIGVHSEWINANRLCRLVERLGCTRVRAYWAAIGKWKVDDRRFSSLLRMAPRQKAALLGVGNDFQMERKGPDSRFRGSALLVPAGTLRERASDVMSPIEVAKIHVGYRTRVLMGPSYRADMWALLEVDETLTASELARRAYGSYDTARHVKRDYELFVESRLRAA